MAWKPPSKVGDRSPDIPAGKAKLSRFSYGQNLGATDEYTAEFGAALKEFGRRVHGEVIKGKRMAPDVNTVGEYDWAIKVQLGVIDRAPAGPVNAPRKRHPAYVFRGTGGVIGQDLVSLVCQSVTDLVEEINPPWAATMGGIPVGTAGNINDPSMWTAVQGTVAWTQNDIIGRIRANPKIKIIVGGYSAGAIVAAIVIDWLKKNYPDNYLCSFSFGDPTRPFGGGFFGRPPAWGRGISTISYGDPTDWRHCWLAHDGDMYTQIPGGVAGDIMDDIYEEVTRFAFTDLMAVTLRVVTAIPTVMTKAGIPLTGVLSAMAGGLPGIILFGFTNLLASLGGLIPGGKPDDQLTGQAAAARAAVIAVTFLFQGTGPHIRYHLDAAWPGGPTFLQLAQQHVRDWASRHPAE